VKYNYKEEFLKEELCIYEVVSKIFETGAATSTAVVVAGIAGKW
jgi:hypothetical protein